MKKYQVSIFFSLVSITGIVYQNYRLAEMFNTSTGKTRALFGITEVSQLDVKVYLGLVSIISLIFAVLALWKKENRKLAWLSIGLSGVAIILLFIRFWKLMI